MKFQFSSFRTALFRILECAKTNSVNFDFLGYKICDGIGDGLPKPEIEVGCNAYARVVGKFLEIFKCYFCNLSQK